MWKKPWTYKEGTLVATGLVVVALLLQLLVGPFPWRAFAWPVNLICLLLGTAGLLYAHLLRPKVYLFRFLATPQMAVPALVSATLLTVAMGLVRQVGAQDPPQDAIGLTKMLQSWPFVLSYFLLVCVLGLTSLKQASAFCLRKLPSLLCHLGLALFITVGSLGHPDMQRLKMHCKEGQVQHTARNARGLEVPLPFALRLLRFEIITAPAAEASTPRRIQQYISEVELRSPEGKIKRAAISVNHPLRMGAWRIYQYSYGAPGKDVGPSSTLELVRDPWLAPVYVGLYMILCGAVLQFFYPGRRRNDTPPSPSRRSQAPQPSPQA